jgi:periplasmic divalent cation tolerance protein
MITSIYVTVSGYDEAKKLAKLLLEKKLVACANIFPITSIYYWKGELQNDNEHAMIMKTQTDLVDKLITELKEYHSYEVPCIVSWDVAKGNEDYIAWVEDETKQ